MIKVKHFQTERTEKLPNWTAVEDFLNGFHFGDLNPYLAVGTTPRPHATIVDIKAYPTGPNHNLVVIIDVEETVAANSGATSSPK